MSSFKQKHCRVKKWSRRITLMLCHLSSSTLCWIEAHPSIADELKLWIGGCKMGIGFWSVSQWRLGSRFWRLEIRAHGKIIVVSSVCIINLFNLIYHHSVLLCGIFLHLFLVSPLNAGLASVSLLIAEIWQFFFILVWLATHGWLNARCKCN